MKRCTARLLGRAASAFIIYGVFSDTKSTDRSGRGKPSVVERNFRPSHGADTRDQSD